MRQPLVLLPLLFAPSIASAGVLLSMDFEDPADPWRDDSPIGHLMASETFNEEWPGAGVVQDLSSGSPEGAAAWFDGGSNLAFVASPPMAWDPAIGVTVRFLFRSPGVNRTSYGHYAPRMHALGFGAGTGQNWDVDLDDADGTVTGLWTYWTGEGDNATVLGDSLGAFTNDAWYEYYWTWDGATARGYIREAGGNWIDVGSSAWSAPIGEAGSINHIGRASVFGEAFAFGFVGWIDGLRVVEGAFAPDLCPATPAFDTADFDGDGIGDACEPEIFLDIGGSCPAGNTVQIAHLTPRGTFAVVRSASPGALTIPTGGCAGYALPLNMPATLVTTVTAPPSGVLNLAPVLGGAWCGRYVSVVDLATCRVSPAVQIP